jgi:hypothetical protein
VKRGTIIALAGGIVAVIAIVAGVWWFFGRAQGPEATASAYLDALEAGDYDAIQALRPEPDDDSVLEGAFAGASAYVTDARVIELTEQKEGVAVVEAEAQLGGDTHRFSFTLEQSGGRWLLSGDDKGVLTATATVGGAAAGDSVRIGETLAPAGVDVPLLGAEYQVAPAANGVLTGSGLGTVVPGETTSVEIEAALSPDATTLAQDQLDVYLDECAAPASEVPANCGIRVPWAADLTSLDSIAFRIDERPVLALSADATTFDATGGVIVATATGPSRAGGTGSFTYRADDWAVRGDVRFEGGQMVLAVR